MTALPSPAPIVGHFSHSKTASKDRLDGPKHAQAITFESEQAKRLREYIEVWKATALRSNYSNPTHMLTVNFSFSPHLSNRLKQEPASVIRADLFRSLSGYYRQRGAPWLSVWVMEARHGRHVHALISVPKGGAFRSGLVQALLSHVGENHPLAMLCGVEDLWKKVQSKNTGEPVCIRPISNSESFRGLSGLDGAALYLGKEIDRNSQSSITKKRLGRLVGASRLVAAWRNDWRIAGSSSGLTLAGAGRYLDKHTSHTPSIDMECAP